MVARKSVSDISEGGVIEVVDFMRRRFISLCISYKSNDPFIKFLVMGAFISRFVIASKHFCTKPSGN